MAKRKHKLPGLYQHKNGYWHLDKVIAGHRINKSTGEKNYATAESIASEWINTAKNRIRHGETTRLTLYAAAALFLERETKKSIACDANDLQKICEHIGHLYIDQIHNDTLQPYIQQQRESGGYGKGAKASTINRSLRTLTRVLRLASLEWRDDLGKPYLDRPPLIRQLDESDKQITTPVEYHEEARLFEYLNDDYKDLWTFATLTGLREQTQAKLRWEWEREHPKLSNALFVIPRDYLKYGRKIQGEGDWLLILNSKATEIIEAWRGRSDTWVFPSPNGNAYNRFRNTHFKNSRSNAGLEHINWHSARATFATRLRANAVSEEDRSYLLAHKTGSITTQYSFANMRHLAECTELLCKEEEDSEHGLFTLSSLKPKKVARKQ